MNLSQLKSEAQSAIANSYIGEALKLLNEHIQEDADALRLQLIQLTSQYNRLTHEKMAGILDNRDYRTEINTISHSLLQFTGLLTPQHLQQPMADAHRKIGNPILVIGRDEESRETLEILFRALNFTNVEVNDLTFIDKNIDLSKYDVIVFDNMDLPFCNTPATLQRLPEDQQALISSRIAVMDQVIQGSSIYIVHYGTILYWINDHRNRVQSANSQFSLYARTKEVLEFLNTYRVG